MGVFFVSLRVEYFIVLLSWYIMVKTVFRKADSYALRMFAQYVAAMFAFSVINLFSQMSDLGAFKSADLVFIVNALYMISICYGSLRWFVYEEAVAGKKTFDGTIKKLLWLLPIIALVILTLLSWKTGWIFYIDENVTYQRGNLWMAQFTICYFYVFMAVVRALIFLFKNKEVSNFACVVVGINSIIVLIGCILQAFYGHSYIAIAITMGTVVSYVELYTREAQNLERMEELKELLKDKEEKNIELQKAINNFNKADYDRRTDFLTGLRSRQDMFEILHDSLSGNIEPIRAMYMIDIDNFKALNDRYGHIYGDECLKRIGAVLNEYSEKHGMVFYRYGGEEMFGISFKNGTDPEKTAADIVKMIADLKIERDDMPLGYVTVSLGYTTNNNRYEKMIDKADKAMYQAKKNGKNQYVCYEDIEDVD